MSLKIVFMGSPEFSVPTLRGLAQNYQIAGVVTQPDRASGRGRKITPPPVKTVAEELGLPVMQPLLLRQPEAMEQLQAWSPDLIVVAAFGQILRPNALELPPFGCLNVHASLLPRWRGAAPIQAAILHGDRQTGVTIMRMDPGIDTGPMLSQRGVPINSEDTAASLSIKLAHLGAELLTDTLPGYLNRELLPQPQDESRATYAPMLKKEDGLLDLNLSAVELSRKVRAFNPWPGAYVLLNEHRLIIHRASTRAFGEIDQPMQPGERAILNGMPAISATDGILLLDEVQPAGKKAMDGKAFLQGFRNWV